MSSRQLSVRLCDVPVGTLELHSGSMRFVYESAKRPLSLSMPIRTEPYANKACEAFFGGLLPERSQLKKIIANIYGLNSDSNFNLLAMIGFDCAGAVSLVAPSEPVVIDQSHKLKGKPLAETELKKHLDELPFRPLLAGVDGIRISLAGAQDKAALCLINDVLCIPAAGVPSTHILKPPIRALPHSVANEFFCMTLAKEVGLSAINVEVRRAADIEYLLVERYDRIIFSNDRIKRVHQEDFCQALGVVSTKKYQADGGPNVIDCLELIERLSQPAKDKIELIKRIIFNFLIGNADAHAKNFSIVHQEDGVSYLSPAYDILSTVIYGVTSTKLAMSIGNEFQIDAIRKSNWIKFCEKSKIQPSAFKKICRAIVTQVQRAIPQTKLAMVDDNLWGEVMDQLVAGIQQRITQLTTSLEAF